MKSLYMIKTYKGMAKARGKRIKVRRVGCN